MQQECTNIYMAARRAAGYTRERAAEMIPVSVRSLADYELGHTIPPNDVVERMVICYGAQYLAYQHLHETNILAAKLVPQLEKRSIMESVIRLYNRMRRFEKAGSLDRLMCIAEDNHIDSSERADFDAITAEIRELIQVGMELQLQADE